MSVFIHWHLKLYATATAMKLVSSLFMSRDPTPHAATRRPSPAGGRMFRCNQLGGPMFVPALFCSNE